jgi:hypothetical protein
VKKESSLQEFFETLPYVLPCKHCRKSLSEYITKDPVGLAIKDGTVAKWLWRIHNDVNAKLREQRLPTAPDPPFAKVKQMYEDKLAAGCTRTHFDGWEFLFSVAEAHPYSRAARTSAPIHGHPPLDVLYTATPLERNRWNVMSPEERLPYYNRFWSLLPDVFPFKEWTDAWKSSAKAEATACRTECLKWVWAIRKRMEEDLDLLNKTTYASLCKELREHRSGCGAASVRGKTCRRKRGTTR